MGSEMCIRDRGNLESRISRLEGAPVPSTSMRPRPLATISPGRASEASATWPPVNHNLRERDLRAFERARRSLKIFPIDGESNSELVINPVDLLINVLRLPKTIANGGAIETIRRLAPTRFFANEVLVVFNETTVRDSVIGSSGMLSEIPTNQKRVFGNKPRSENGHFAFCRKENCLLYTSPSPRDLSTSRMPSSA